MGFVQFYKNFTKIIHYCIYCRYPYDPNTPTLYCEKCCRERTQ